MTAQCTRVQIAEIQRLRRSGMAAKQVARTVGVTLAQVTYHHPDSDFLTMSDPWRTPTPPIDLRKEIEQAKLEALTAPPYKPGSLEW